MKPAPHCLPSIVLRAARRLGVVALLALSMVPPAWAIIYVPPVVTSIARLQPGPVTTANTLTWRVTFNAYVTGVDSSDFTLTPVDGSATGTLSSVVAGSSEAEYIVTATGVSGTGTLRLDVNASGTDIIGGLDDLPLAGGFTLGQPYTHTSASMPVAWGDNGFGQLGNSLTTNSPVPVDVLGIGALAGKTVVAVSAGYEHSLALCSDGTVAAWGTNWCGQLGNNSTDGSLVPVAVNTDSGMSALAGKSVVAVAAGGSHSLALCSDGTVAAWGYNSYGRLGNDSTTDSLVPVAVNTDSGTSALAGKSGVAGAAGDHHSLAWCSDGTVASWGSNVYGQLGNTSPTLSQVPVAVNTGALAGKKVVAVAAGGTHSLALCSDDTVAAWGGNRYGQLGNASTSDSQVPVAVNTASALAGKTVVAVSAGSMHSLALCNDGTVAAWGNNGSGRLGNNSTDQSTVPVAVNTAGGTSALSGKTVVAVSAGLDQSLALCSDGTAVAWGINWAGQLGNGLTTPSLVPVAVNTTSSSALSGRTVLFLGTGGIAYHTLALASLPPPPPTTVTALSAPAAGSYKAGDALNFTLTTSAAATVATTGGTPRLALTLGTATRYATYVSGSGTPSLVFRYTVQSGDTDTDGIAIASTSIDLNGGTINNGSGVAIDGTLPSFTLPTIVVDTTAPETSLDTTPANPSASASATFTFSSADASASFAASLDGAAYAAATSPATFTGLADGSHTFSVRAIDAAGNVDATPASFTWTVDTTAPTAPTIASVSSTSIAGTAEAGSTVRVYAGATLLGTTTADGSGNWSLAVTLADGAYSLTAAATDSANNTTSTSGATTRTIDTTAPTLTAVTLVSSNAAPALAKVGDTLTLAFTPSESLQTPTVTLAGASATATYDSVSATWNATHTVAAGDTEGAATFSIAFRDLAGNAGTSVATTSDSSAVTIDRTAPETALVSTPATLSDSRTATFTFSSADVSVSFAASLDGAAYAAATSPLTLTGLADGSHTFSVRAIDAAGNVDATPASFTWTVDTTAPTAPTIASVSSTSIAGTAEAGSTVRVYAGATLLGTTTADGSGNWSLAVTLADGAYSLTAAATDSANNTTSTSGATTRTIDTTAPTVPTGLSGQATSPTAVALVWTASSDAGGVTGYRIHRNGTAIATSAATAYTDTGLTAATAYTYTVTAYDAAGHESAQSAPATVTTQSTGAQALAVGNTAELEAALTTAAANPTATYTITLAVGTYTPTAGLTISTAGLILEGRGTLSGAGLTSGALLTISGGNTALSGLTFADGAVVITAGADDGMIDDCTFTRASLTGTACSGWTITGNSFNATAAALAFSHADDLTFTENVILDCARALVLADVSSPIVRNNFIADNTTTGTTPAISLTDVTTAQIDNNSVYQAGTAASAIEYAGSGALGAIRNNLANRPITATGTATATLTTNYTAAAAGWFRDVTAGDLHLAALRSAVVDAGTTIVGLTVDIDGDTRPTGSAPDLGADEYQADTTAPTAPTGLAATVLSTSQITLSWTASTDTAPSGVPASGVAGYRIYRNGTAIGTSMTASYADTGLSAGTTYNYTVAAYDGAANESAASSGVNATTTTTGATGDNSGGGSGGGGAIGVLLPAVLALLALGRRRFVRR